MSHAPFPVSPVRDLVADETAALDAVAADREDDDSDENEAAEHAAHDACEPGHVSKERQSAATSGS